jgi:ParB family chromosome partitioning protein
MVTATKAAKRVKKPARGPRTIGVIESTADANERYELVMTACLERLKGTTQWRRVAECCADKATIGPAFERESIERLLRDEFATFKWPAADGSDHAEMNGASSGIWCVHHDGTRGYLYWSDLVDEIEEIFTKQTNKNGKPSSKTVGPIGKEKPRASGYAVTEVGFSRPVEVAPLEPPGVNSTSVPGGIAANDPDVVKPGGNGSARKRKLQDVTRSSPWSGDASTCSVSVDDIEPNPYQPRQTFPEAEIRELAASIENHGQLQRVLLRPHPTVAGRYQIADGERRWRAIELLASGAVQDAVLAEVRPIDDRQMAELALVANDDRKDLTAIERAAAYRRMIDEFSLTHEQLAAKLGRSKGYVSNLVRLLDLPAEWQKRVAGGELSPSHAEVILPYAKVPKLSQALAKRFPTAADVPAAKEFPKEVHRCVREHTKEATGEIWGGGHSMRLNFTPDQLAQLDVVEVKGWDGRTQKRAANVTLWNKIVKEKRAKKKTKDGGKAKRDSQQAKWKAEREERERQEKLADVRCRWVNGMIVARLNNTANVPGNRGPSELIQRVLISMAIDDRGADLKGLKRWLHVKRYHSQAEVFQALAKPNCNREKVIQELVAGQFPVEVADRYGFNGRDPELSEAVAEALSIDLAAEFKRALLGEPLTEEWIELHSEEEIIALMRECGVKDTDGMEFDEAVLALEQLPAEKRKLPRELAKAKKQR